MSPRRRTSWWARRGSYIIVLAAVLATVAVVIAGIRLSPTRPDRPITIATAEWAPYVGEDLPNGGPLARIVQLTLAREGYRATVDFSTWDLALGSARQGQAFAAFPLVASEERDAGFVYSDPLVEFEYVLFHDTTQQLPSLEDASALADLRVARIAGYDYWPELDEAVGEYLEYDTSAAAFSALAAGEVDIVPEGRLAGQALLMSPDLGLDATRFLPIEGDAPWLRSTQALHLLVADTSSGRALVRDFNESLGAVKETPEYRSLVASLQPATTSEQVVIGMPDGSVAALLDEAGGRVATLPRGTRATVLTWPEDDGSTEAELLVQVKVTSGPARGQVGYVDLTAIELVDS